MIVAVTRRRQFLRTVIDVRPNHVPNTDNQDAKLDDERVQIGREIPVDGVQVFWTGALDGEVIL